MKASPLQATLVIEYRPIDVIHACGVDKDSQAVMVRNRIVFFRCIVEAHAVGKPSTTTLLDIQAKTSNVAVEALTFDKCERFLGCLFGHRDGRLLRSVLGRTHIPSYDGQYVNPDGAGNAGEQATSRARERYAFDGKCPRSGMSDVDLDSEQYQKHREAGEILATVREEAVDRIEVGASHLELVEHVEDRIRELGGQPAFPMNISIDEEAAHATPCIDDDSTFGEEMINIDIGVAVDGWLADSAITVDLSGNDELVEASAEALEAAIDTIEAGVDTALLGDIIGRTINGYGYNPVVNLTGHGLGHWEQHTTPNIPNRKVPQGTTLEVGDVVAIEPFATDGGGKVKEGSDEEIFALDQEKSIRDRQAREVLKQITDEFRTLPFATRWLDASRPKLALRRLKQQNIIHGYPVLKEQPGYYVSQKEHTVIVTEDGCEVTTR